MKIIINDNNKSFIDKIFTKVIPIERLSQHSEFTYEVRSEILTSNVMTNLVN